MFPSNHVEFEHSTCRHCAGVLSDVSALEQLVSGDGIEIRVTRLEFRRAFEQGCTVCLVIHGVNSSETFSIFDEDDLSDDGPEIIRNCTANTCLEGGPCDLEQITVTIFWAEDGKSTEGEFDVYADPGNVLNAYFALKLCFVD